MKKDPIISAILKALKIRDSSRNHNLLLVILYNFVPAFIFAPYLAYIGLKFDLALVLLIGIALFLVDLTHFIRAMKNLSKY